MGKGLLRYTRWISSFTKLDNNKSNNNNDNNNLKSNIFCLCSILLIHINRGIFTPHVQVYTFRRKECTGATTEKGHISGVSRPNFHLCAQSSDLHMGLRPNVPGPPTSTAHARTLTLSSGTQDRLCGPAHRALRSSACRPDEGVSAKTQTGELDPGVQKLCVGCSLFLNSRVQNMY